MTSRQYSRAAVSCACAKYRPWSSTEIDDLITLRDFDEMEWGEIAQIVGHTIQQCVNRYQIVKGFRNRDNRRKSLGIPLADQKALAKRDARLAARDARDNAALESGNMNHLTGDFPPPGYSALDKRRVRA